MALPDYAMRQPSFPEMYERLLVQPLFRPFAETVLDRVNLTPGDRALTVRFPEGKTFVRMNTMAFVGMSAAKALDETARAAVVDAIAMASMEAVSPHLRNNELVFDLSTNLATA